MLTIEQLFQEWTVQFNRTYASIDERSRRRQIWIENHALIESHNNNNHHQQSSYRLGHNHLSDMTLEEIRQGYRLGRYHSNTGTTVQQSMTRHVSTSSLRKGTSSNTTTLMATQLLQDEHKYHNNQINYNHHTMSLQHQQPQQGRRLLNQQRQLPIEFNWVTRGGVTSVKNQWFCGACWAFSAVGAIEGALFVSTGELLSLSVQQLLDCDQVDGACGGGMPDSAFDYDTTGLCKDSSYHYRAKRNNHCQRRCDAVPHTTVQSYEFIKGTNQDYMKAILQQPISVLVQAMERDFLFYKSGVFDGNCGIDTDHAVLLVGYGTQQEDGQDYWLVKNSWGQHWGEAGYMKIARTDENKGGKCGILTYAVRPLVSEAAPGE